jgi:AcrR family transcriptional regulator
MWSSCRTTYLLHVHKVNRYAGPVRTGRPRTVSDEAIYEAVSALVGEVGPSGLTLAAIAERVGLSAPALTQRFGSKRNLLVAHAKAAAGGIDDLFERVRRASPSPVAALRAGLIEFTSGVDSRDAFANHLALLHLDLTDPELGAHAARQSRLLRRSIARLIEEAIDAGEMLAADPAELADTIYTVYNGALVGWAIDGKGSLPRWLSTRLDRVLASLRSASARPPERPA